MPWSEDYYPPAMAHLHPVVRLKAIEIANALLQEGHDDGFCIRVAIARAMINKPLLILADEPTGNLDPDTSTVVFAALSDLVRKEGAAALIATHNFELAKYMDRVMALDHGKLVRRS